MNPFTKKLNIAQYIKEGHDLNIINKKTGQTFIEYVLNWIANSPSSTADRYALFDLLCNPKLKTDNLSIQENLSKVTPFFNDIISINYPDDSILFEQILKSNLNTNTFKDKDLLKFFTFCSRFDLSKDIPDRIEKNWIFYFFNSEKFYLYKIAKAYHPQFKEAIKKSNYKGQTLWHQLCASSQELNLVINELICLNEHFPEGKYLADHNGVTPKDLLNKIIEQLIKSELSTYESDTILSLIDKMILNENLNKDLKTSNKIMVKNKI